MHNAAPSEVQLRVSSAARDRVAAWIGRELRDDAHHGLVAAALYTVACLVVNALIVFFVAVLTFEASAQLLIEAAEESLLFAPVMGLAVLCIGYPIQFGMYRRSQRRVRLQSGWVTLPRSAARDLPGSDSAGVIGGLVQVSAFPAWLAARALHHLLAPWRAARADTQTLARILVVLLERGKRVSLFDLEDAIPKARLAPAVNLLVHFPGVIVWKTDYPALSINDDLRAKLTKLM